MNLSVATTEGETSVVAREERATLAIVTSQSDPGHERGFFVGRHVGTTEKEQLDISAACGVGNAAELLGRSIPAEVRDAAVLDVLPATSERAILTELRNIARQNVVAVSMIGLGYHDMILPAVLRRSVLESSAWYSTYKPYQAEMSQGRLEALLLFQTMVSDLTAFRSRTRRCSMSRRRLSKRCSSVDAPRRGRTDSS